MSAPEFIAPTNNDDEPWPRRHGVPLADSLESFNGDKPAEPCRVGTWESRLSATEMDLLRPHLRHGNIRPLFDHLRHDGVDLPFSATTWERHWTGRCACKVVRRAVA